MYVLALRDQNKEYIGRDIEEVEIYAIKSKDILTFTVDENIIEDLKEQLNQAALDIKSGEFDSRKCGDCKYCQYSKICNQQWLQNGLDFNIAHGYPDTYPQLALRIIELFKLDFAWIWKNSEY